MRRATSKTKRTSASVTPLTYDVAGITIVVLSLISLYSLYSPGDAGEIGRDINRMLRMLAGAGAYVFPFLGLMVAALLLFGALRVQLTKRTLAAVGLWLVSISWLQVTGSDWPAPPDQFFSYSVTSQGGGIAGAGISYFLLVALGEISTLVVLGGLGLAALIVLIDVPVLSMLAGLFREGRQKAPAVPADHRTLKHTSTAAPPAAPGPEPPAQKVDRDSLIEKAIENQRRATEEDRRQLIKSREVLAAANPARKEDQQALDMTAPEGDFELPPIELLDPSPPTPERSADELREKVEIIERTLQEFKISANVVEIAHGPTVTRYEIQLAPGILVNKIVKLADNIAMSLSAINVRVEAPIPGKSAIGVEVPNRHRGLVGLRDMIQCDDVRNHPSKLAFPLGLDVAGNPMIADLTSMPHMLVAGATNMGKSVMLNSLISSLLYRATPEEVRLVLIDPKRVELSLFDGIPHLISPVIRDVRAAAGILRAAVQQMELRYDKLANAGTKNIQSFNQSVEPRDRLPYMVIVVDELADLMMQAAAEVEGSICRIAQLARAVGIHLVIATQRPSVDVVTGTIKANIASRAAFAVSSQVDSRTVLDQNGAERLIGRGDMLFRPIDAPKPIRIQGIFISEDEIKRLVSHLKEQRAPDYSLRPQEAAVTGAPGGGGEDPESATSDEYYQPAVRLVVQQGRASTSMIQRRYRIGYTRAARLVDAMEVQGIVGPADGANPREVLVSPEMIDDILGLPSGTTAMEREYDDEEELPA